MGECCRFPLFRSIGESPSVHPFRVLPCGGGGLVVVFHMQAGRLPPPPPAPTLAVLHLPPPAFSINHGGRRRRREEGKHTQQRCDFQRFPKTEIGLSLRALRFTCCNVLYVRTFYAHVILGRRRHILLSKGRRRRDLLLLLLSDDKPLTLAAGHSPPPSTFLLLLDMLSFIGVSLTSSLSPFPYPKNLQRHKNLRGELFFGRFEHISPNVWRFPPQEPRKTFFPHSNSLNCFFSLLSSDTSPPF